MMIRAKLNTQTEWLFSEDLPDIYTYGEPLLEKHSEIISGNDWMNNHLITTHGLFILHTEMRFDDAAEIVTEVTGDVVACQFVFALAESNRTGRENANRSARGRHNIHFIPSRTESHKIRSGVSYIYFLVVLSKSYYLQLVDLNLPINDRFIQQLKRGNYVTFAEGDQLITSEMRKSIQEIHLCRHEGELKRLYTDSRVMELIMFQLEQLSQQTNEGKTEFKEEDLEKLENAREILMAQFNEPPTHRQLSKLVFLNEFKLRSGFKRYYGATIYDFITGLRMNEARRLILEEQKNMSEVGTMVGFKHQASFTHAFKKYYGILPSEVKMHSSKSAQKDEFE